MLTNCYSNQLIKPKKIVHGMTAMNLVNSTNVRQTSNSKNNNIKKIKIKLITKNSSTIPKRISLGLTDSPTKFLKVKKSNYKKQQTLEKPHLFHIPVFNASENINDENQNYNQNEAAYADEFDNESNKVSPFQDLLEKSNKINSVFNNLEKIELPKIESPPTFKLDINDPLEYSFGEITNKKIKKGKTLKTGVLNTFYKSKNSPFTNKTLLNNEQCFSTAKMEFGDPAARTSRERHHIKSLLKKCTFSNDNAHRKKRKKISPLPYKLDLGELSPTQHNNNFNINNNNDGCIEMKDINNNDKDKISYNYINTDTNSTEREIRLNSAKISSRIISEHIQAYGVNSYKSQSKDCKTYNKVSIILSIQKPKHYKDNDWPMISFFGIYEGEYANKSNKCCEFLRDNLHHYIVGSNSFPKDPRNALIEGFSQAETDYNQANLQTNDTLSNSCSVLVALILNEMMYLALVGEGDALLGSFDSQRKISLRTPESSPKQRRVSIQMSLSRNKNLIALRQQPVSSSKKLTFTNMDMKFSSFEKRNFNPQITQHSLKNESFDFLFLANSRVFNELSNDDIYEEVYKGLIESKKRERTLHSLCGETVNNLLRKTIEKSSKENVSCVLLYLKSFLDKYDEIIESMKNEKENNKEELMFSKVNEVLLLEQNKEEKTKIPMTMKV